jgi:hypothetical protein
MLDPVKEIDLLIHEVTVEMDRDYCAHGYSTPLYTDLYRLYRALRNVRDDWSASVEERKRAEEYVPQGTSTK